MLKKTLNDLRITERDNRKLGFDTFSDYPYNFTNSDLRGMEEAERAWKGKKQDVTNLLISYCDLKGNLLHYKPSGRRWSEVYCRIRFSEANRFTTDDGKKSPKYKTSKKTPNQPFLNGLFIFDLKPDGTLWIVEGEKKAIAGCSIGLPMVGISGIHNAVETERENLTPLQVYEGKKASVIKSMFLPLLLEYIEREEVRTIYYLLDNDCFDNKGNLSRARSFFSAIKYFKMACDRAGTNMNLAYIADKSPDAKGLDDLLLKNNYDTSSLKDDIKIYELFSERQMKKLEIAFATSVLGQEVFIPEVEIEHTTTANRKLLSILSKPSDLLSYNNIIPTGAGKTYTTAQIRDYIIISTPTKALASNIAGEYDAIRYQSSTKRDLVELLSSGSTDKFMISVTYDSLPNLVALIDSIETDTGIKVEDFNLVIDEAHNFTASSNRGYRLKAMNRIISVLPRFKSFSSLSGTYLPNLSPELNRYPIRRVNLPLSDISGEIRACADTLKATAYLIEESIECGRFPVVLFNHKGKDSSLGSLMTYLSQVEGLKFFNSDTKNDQGWKELTSKGILKEGIRGIVTTSVLKEGNNILNNYKYDFILVGSYHVTEWAQFVRRARRPKDVTVTWVISKNKALGEDSNDNFYSLAPQSIYKYADMIIKMTEVYEANRYVKLEHIGRSIIGGTPIRYDKEKREFYIDWLELSNIIYLEEKRIQNGSPERIIRDLTEFHINLRWGDPIEIEKTKEEKIEAKAFRKLQGEAKEETYLAELEELRDKANPYRHVLKALSNTKQVLDEGKILALKRVDSVAPFFSNPVLAIDYLKEIGVKETDFKRARTRLLFSSLKGSDEYLGADTQFGTFLKGIDKILVTEVEYTGEELRSEFVRACQLDPNINVDKYEKEEDMYSIRKAIDAVKYFFEVERERISTESGRAWVYILTSLEDVLGLDLDVKIEDLTEDLGEDLEPIEVPF